MKSMVLVRRGKIGNEIIRTGASPVSQIPERTQQQALVDDSTPPHALLNSRKPD